MPSGLLNRSLVKVAERVPGVRRIPVVALLAAAEVAVLAKDHYQQRLTPAERRRLLRLIKVGRGGTDRLTAGERDELEALVTKLEPRRLLGDAARRLSPVPIPRRLLYGRRR